MVVRMDTTIQVVMRLVLKDVLDVSVMMGYVRSVLQESRERCVIKVGVITDGLCKECIAGKQREEYVNSRCHY